MAIAEEIIGTHYRYPDYFEVDREKIREFARAVKDDHRAHHDEEAAKESGYDGLIASLTFLAVAGRKVQAEIFNQFDVPINMERMLHRDQKITFHRPIVAGDKLFFDSYLDSVIEAHGGAEAAGVADKQARVWQLISAYRTRGCQLADLDRDDRRPHLPHGLRRGRGGPSGGSGGAARRQDRGRHPERGLCRA